MIKLEHVNYAYKHNKLALKNINLNIKENETIGIIGANGAGKSTLLKTIIGLIIPESGTVTINQMVMNEKNRSSVYEKIGYVFQNSDHQLFMPKVFDEVAFYSRQKKTDENQVKQIVEEALHSVNAMNLISDFTHELSGGEKKQVAIASVLTQSPHTIILDEPSASLDPQSRRMMINLLKSMTQTQIIASHDLDLIADLCDRTIVLKNGEIIADNKTKIILTDELLLKKSSLELPLRLQFLNW